MTKEWDLTTFKKIPQSLQLQKDVNIIKKEISRGIREVIREYHYHAKLYPLLITAKFLCRSTRTGE